MVVYPAVVYPQRGLVVLWDAIVGCREGRHTPLSHARRTHGELPSLSLSLSLSLRIAVLPQRTYNHIHSLGVSVPRSAASNLAHAGYTQGVHFAVLHADASVPFDVAAVLPAHVSPTVTAVVSDMPFGENLRLPSVRCCSSSPSRRPRPRWV